MTKRVLVVDNVWRKTESYLQYMTVDFDGDLKNIVRYRKFKCDNCSNTITQMIVDLFYDNNCDEIYMDVMGSSICIYELLPDDIRNVTQGFKCTLQTNHNRISNMNYDFNNRNIFICKDAIELYDVIKILGNDKSIYYTKNGLMKIGKYIDDDTRDKVHMMLGMYK